MEHFGKLATATMLTHLHRDLAHAIWQLLLDEDLMRAYTEGEAIKLLDEIMRAMFPRFLILLIIRKSKLNPFQCDLCSYFLIES